jgi:hypothetical protein
VVFWNLGRIKTTEKQQRDDANFGEAEFTMLKNISSFTQNISKGSEQEKKTELLKFDENIK